MSEYLFELKIVANERNRTVDLLITSELFIATNINILINLSKNNYKMNLANYSVPSPWKTKSPKSNKIIRSAAFRKKFEDGLPRINQKAIPFHNVYDI